MDRLEKFSQLPQFTSISGNIFKHRGAWFSLHCPNVEYGAAELRLITHHGGKMQARDREVMMRVYPTFEGRKVPFAIGQEASCLTLHSLHGCVRFTASGANLILAEGDAGMGLRFEKQMEQHETVKRRARGAWEAACRCSVSLVFMGLEGSGFDFGDNTWDWEGLSSGKVAGVTVPNADGTFTLAIEEFTHAGKVRDAYPSFEEARAGMQADWEAFRDKFTDYPGDEDRAHRVTRYTQWSYLLEPRGSLAHTMLLMLTSDLCSQWQLCQNAVALEDHMDIAMELLLAPLDRVSPEGQLSDVYDDVFCIRQMYKPPVHGWAVKELMSRHDLLAECPREKVEQLYTMMARWGDWFMENRDDDGDGIPAYEHGDETGFDDCTLFKEHNNVAAPDLSAYLVLLFEALGDLARLLEKGEETAEAWYEKSRTLLDKMLKYMWDGRYFCGLLPYTGEKLRSASCIHYIPLVLGDRLGKEVLDALTDSLMADEGLLTEHGVASESVFSDDYRPAGMCMSRGYILPPAMIFLCSGLLNSGRRAEGLEITRRYCESLAKGNFPFLMHPLRGAQGGFFGGTWPCAAFTVLYRAMKAAEAE